MRILIVHNILWAHYKSSVFQAIQQLADQQPNVMVNVLQIARNERSRASLETINDPSVPTYSYNYELLFDRFLEDVSLRERTNALLRRASAFKPDVITLTGYYDPAQIFLLLWARTKGIRVILQNESTATDHQRGGWKERIKQWIFSQCSGFFCFGSQSADYLIQLGVQPDKILLRKSAVDNNALRVAYERALSSRIKEQQVLALRPNNFVFVGRLIGYKNLPLLLSAFAEAQKQSPLADEWGIILLGDGVEKNSLIEQINTLALTDSVHILPGRPWFEVPDVLAMSNVLVLPSSSEPWGLVVNEAMACGLPVIVSDRCGCAPDLVHEGKNGFVFTYDQPDQLTQLMLRFIDGDVDVAEMSFWAQKLIAPYAPDVVAQEMLNGYKYILTK
ncbi:glycosyltransferase family 4 protein [Spirosoma endophyticum]|uniref:Glycosyltransferase involved in cell wall bisynthesis n=1 Tax=Spirosoma endophyticum TaxID=662367 RepID=A0A1I2ARQ4_9BACT|nr:glycosyltransferase family 4 protein [Spirosoma endophyticum]SFE46238.1 Glycosyltransferase involved in cell wall bisynthesis [Spirosoma endophyticum]